MNTIANENCFGYLEYFLEFLAAWEKRHAGLTPVAYLWCSAMSEAAGRLGQREIPISQPGSLSSQQEIQLPFHTQQHLRAIFRQPQYTLPQDSAFQAIGKEFSNVGPSFDPTHYSGTSHHIFRSQLGTTDLALYLLPVTLEIAFRLVVPGQDQPDLHLPDAFHYDWVFETAFSSEDDEIIADVICAWIADNHPASSCVHHFAKRVRIDQPFSQRLRQLSIHAIEHTWHRELEVSVSETVSLLNHLKVDVDEMGNEWEWTRLFVAVISLPTGPESLSSHYWHLMGKPQSITMRGCCNMDPPSFSAVTKSLEKAEDWEKLENWMMVTWWFGQNADAEFMADIEQVTHRLLSQQPSALLRFEELSGELWGDDQKVKLQQFCNQMQTEQTSLVFPPL